jgi:hypothetical protein
LKGNQTSLASENQIWMWIVGLLEGVT